MQETLSGFVWGSACRARRDQRQPPLKHEPPEYSYWSPRRVTIVRRNHVPFEFQTKAKRLQAMDGNCLL